jgi:diaminohydroxyphosphoribosylaminopyrimidine deaminase / 5-amino-6-(5-phosphoribosylamino)uracil reductase
VVVRDGKVVGEGWHERKGGPHAEVVALASAGEEAREGTLYVTLEPCRTSGATPPCTTAVLAAGITKVVAGALDPSPDAGGGLEELRRAGIDVELAEGELGVAARRQNEAWRTWIAKGRPFVTYKAAITLDGRVTVPESRWVTGGESRRRVHELRAAADAVAVGMGTVRADDPKLDARDVGADRQPRRLAFGSGPLPEGSGLEVLSGSLENELAGLAAEGVQSLLLEGGPTLATAFVRGGLVDKLMLFVAPVLSGAGPRFLGALESPLTLTGLEAEPIGEDLLVSVYINAP